jgi:hypothetical protein
MSRAKVIDHYLKKINDEGFDVYQIRKELEKNEVDDEEIKIIVKLVDNELQRNLKRKRESNSVKPAILMGLILMVIGAGITIATYTGIIDMGNSFLIVYGPFFGGLSILFGGLAKRKK